MCKRAGTAMASKNPPQERAAPARHHGEAGVCDRALERRIVTTVCFGCNQSAAEPSPCSPPVASAQLGVLFDPSFSEAAAEARCDAGRGLLRARARCRSATAAAATCLPPLPPTASAACACAGSSEQRGPEGGRRRHGQGWRRGQQHMEGLEVQGGAVTPPQGAGSRARGRNPGRRVC